MIFLFAVYLKYVKVLKNLFILFYTIYHSYSFLFVSFVLSLIFISLSFFFSLFLSLTLFFSLLDVRVIAWGLSLERPTMIKYRIENIRDLFGHKADIPRQKNAPIARFDHIGDPGNIAP